MTLIDRLMRRRRFLVLAASLWASLMAGVPSAQGQTATIAEFGGPWVGRTAAGAPVDRAMTVLIEMRDRGGFAVTWTSFEAERQIGRPRKVTKRERTLRFERSMRPGLWRAVGSGDPVNGFSAWARIKDRTLSINVVAVADDGELEQQIYDRSLTPTGLKLKYRRLENGVETRAFEADYLRP